MMTATGSLLMSKEHNCKTPRNSYISRQQQNHNTHCNTTTTTRGGQLSKSEYDYIRQGCMIGCRMDGRTPNEFRHYTIQTTTTTKSSLLYNTSSSLQTTCYGSSRLYDTVSNGVCIDMICSIKAELVKPSTPSQQYGDIELSLYTDPTTSSSSNSQMMMLLREYEMTLQQYYIPSLLHAINQQQNLTSNNNKRSYYRPLCVIPTILVWKLYIDVHVISLLSNHNDASTSLKNSVYYLDAVTHCINAAIYTTMLPSINYTNNTASRSSLTASTRDTPAVDSFVADRIILDPIVENSQSLMLVSNDTTRTTRQRLLPIVITTNVIRNDNTIAMNKNDDIATLIFDATNHEEIVSDITIHALVIPQQHPNDGIATSDSNGTSVDNAVVPVVEYEITSIWKTQKGSMSLSLLPQCINIITRQIAPIAYNSYHYES